MRSRPLLLSFILSFVKNSAGFNIEGVPAQVALNQLATVVWTHEQGDPTSFGLAAAPTPFSFSSAIVIGSAEAIPQQTGTMIFRVSKNQEKPLYLAAWDTRKESLEAVIRASAPPIFKGPTPVTVRVQLANSQTPTSSSSPTTELSSVRISTASSSLSGTTTTEATTRDTASTISDPTRVPPSDTSSNSTSTVTSDSPAASSTFTQSSNETQPTSEPIATSSNSDTVKTRIIAGSVVGSLAVIIIASLGLWYWRRKRMWERIQIKRGHWQPLDDDVETVSPSSKAPSSRPPTVSKKPFDDIGNPATRREVEGHEGETTESQATDQPNVDLSWRLDLMSRDLAELRRMVHNSRGEEESLPDYSSR
ncbi:hypothetical protein PM082_009711 [Marasmius tenuissimus]|nr:hypothetical protein PM082_009711 [Marasmius tenuissimus]